LRALEVLARPTLIACEDTRITRRLPTTTGSQTPLTPYTTTTRRGAAENLGRGWPKRGIALVSGRRHAAGVDPGYKLGREAPEAGLEVTRCPAPPPCWPALAVSALPTDRFFFEGFPA